MHDTATDKKYTRTVIELGVLFLLLALIASAFYYSNRVPFDSPKWKAAAHESSMTISTRSRMVDELLSSRRLIGLQPAQVENLLGKPDETDFHEWDWAYRLGMYVTDARYLVIQFDGHKKVSKYQIHAVD